MQLYPYSYTTYYLTASVQRAAELAILWSSPPHSRLSRRPWRNCHFIFRVRTFRQLITAFTARVTIIPSIRAYTGSTPMQHQDVVSRGWFLYQPDISVKKNMGIGKRSCTHKLVPRTGGTRSLGSLAGVTLKSGMFFSSIIYLK